MKERCIHGPLLTEPCPQCVRIHDIYPDGPDRWKKGEAVVVSRHKQCDLHKYQLDQVVEALYDGKTRTGPWANMCQDCFTQHGVGLGTGRGQRLLVMP